MPAQELAQPNPPPDPSQLQDAILDWSVKLQTKDFLSSDELQSVRAFRRAADYIAAGVSSLPLTHPSHCRLIHQQR